MASSDDHSTESDKRFIENISGASILGDGSIALILDASKLISSVEADEAA